MSIFEMLIWVVTIVVAVYLIIGVYHLIKLINWKLPEYLSESGVIKQTHVKVGVWMVIGLSALGILSTLVSPFF